MAEETKNLAERLEDGRGTTQPTQPTQPQAASQQESQAQQLVHVHLSLGTLRQADPLASANSSFSLSTPASPSSQTGPLTSPLGSASASPLSSPVAQPSPLSLPLSQPTVTRRNFAPLILNVSAAPPPVIGSSPVNDPSLAPVLDFSALGSGHTTGDELEFDRKRREEEFTQQLDLQVSGHDPFADLEGGASSFASPPQSPSTLSGDSLGTTVVQFAKSPSSSKPLSKPKRK